MLYIHIYIQVGNRETSSRSQCLGTGMVNRSHPTCLQSGVTVEVDIPGRSSSERSVVA